MIASQTNIAAPPTPWSNSLAEPDIHPTAYIHAFANIIGDVRIGKDVMIAPGISIRADEGSPFSIGERTNIQDGVVIHGLQQDRVIGDDGDPYSVWIGHHTSITHMALIHGPAYVGNNCFIGFRSTVFNATVGDGCIVMMHALVEDVIIPPGKYVPSGSIITTQEQANRLPNVQPGDQQFAARIVGVNDALRAGYHCADDDKCIIHFQTDSDRDLDDLHPINSGLPGMDSSGLELPTSTTDSAICNVSNSRQPEADADLVQIVRQLIDRGCRVSIERADKRRFQTSSWISGDRIESQTETGILAAISDCIANHPHDYIRAIGVDAQAKRRVWEQIIHRPVDGSRASGVVENRSMSPNGKSSHASQHSQGNTISPALTIDAVATISRLFAQGYGIFAEFANERRYKSNVWETGGRVTGSNAAEIVRSLTAMIGDRQKSYIRVVGVDQKARQRIVEQVIYRPIK